MLVLKMFFKQRTNDDASISYLFGCGSLGKAVAVDVVAGDEAWYLEQARRLNVAITTVFDTHVHADHLSGGYELARVADANYAMHESNVGKTSFTFTPVADKQVILAGNTRVEILHTPGHTEDSISLLVSDFRRGDAPWFAITGDTLLVGAVGRPDLAGREQEMAARLWRSLHEKLLVLPDDLEIFPGHQAGSACGADISGKPSSTIGFEKRWNPLLSMDKETFIAAVTANIPARPINMDQLIAANLGRPRDRHGNGLPT
jgi:glyoxylase-like metal-dependent hydrolase (beta-lactamase superfamily II)